MADPHFVAVDWGTTSFRLWVMDEDANILATTSGPYGMSRLKPNEYDHALEDSLRKLNVARDIPVIISGMAGAAQGWCEAPYLSAPTQLDDLGAGAVKVAGASRDVRILPGVKQSSPANVMRGEETQIAGLLREQPDFDGIACLPGTHTKWVRINNRAINAFETCMTGEQFAFFSATSVLSHSMADGGWDENAFETAVRLAINDPLSVPRRLFAIRAEMLVAQQSSAQARATLSGLLIGQELMSVPHYWQGQHVTLIGAAALCDPYFKALGLAGGAASIVDVTAMTLAGIAAVHQQGLHANA
ncbi:2-dehydro-3-deoxygalactonokinase [Phaeobacter sp. C3_T13_0]|uniref:2-dehydro-3-deoxygalactonokinase n=1 Tax=Phaeobacter cretensis TaxID=3342641 RepID=UPI0039BC681E